MNRFFSFTWLLILALWFVGCRQNSEPAASADASRQTTQAAKGQEASRVILFFGNSLTAAYGLDPDQGFAGLIAQRIDSLALPYKVVNAGLSGETSAGGRERIGWIAGRQPIDIFILELGGNDGLRGIDPAATEQNLQAIIETVKAKNPAVKIVIAGMEAPPNMGADFTSRFRSIFPKLANLHESSLIPFLLQDVGGIAELNQEDGIHPTEEGHRIVSENIWRILQPLL